jgi:hypothetical protein
MLKKIIWFIAAIWFTGFLGLQILDARDPAPYTSKLPTVNSVPGLIMSSDGLDNLKEYYPHLFSPEGQAPVETGFWKPSLTEIKALEKTLAAYVWQHPPGQKSFGDYLVCRIGQGPLVKEILYQSFRQYYGVEIAGKRHIYVNAVSPWVFAEEEGYLEASKDGIIGVADGGPTNFILRFDVAKNRIEYLYYGVFFRWAVLTAYWIGLPCYLYILFYAVRGHKMRDW